MTPLRCYESRGWDKVFHVLFSQLTTKNGRVT